jgi:Putative zinc-finger
MEHDHPARNTPARACDEMKALLSAYLDGELSRDERVRADTHLVRCAACRDLLERAERLDRTIREEFRLEEGSIDAAAMGDRVFAAIGPRKSSRLRWIVPVAIAASLAGAAAIGASILRGTPAPSKSSTLVSLDADERQLLYSTSVILNGLRRPGFESTGDFNQFRDVARYDELVARLDAITEKLAPEERPTVILARQAIQCLLEASSDPARWEELRRDMERTDLPHRVDGLSEV